MEHFQPSLAHQLEPAARASMKGNHFTSSHLSIASELYPQLLIDVCHGPLSRSAPCWNPPWLNVHTMEPMSQCYSTECPTPPRFHLIQIKHQRPPPSDQLIEGLLSYCDVSMTPTMALKQPSKELLLLKATNKMTSYLQYRKKKATIYRD